MGVVHSLGELQVINVQKCTNQEENKCVTQPIRNFYVCTFLRKNAKENRYNMLEESRFIMMEIGFFSSHFVLMLEENLKWGR